MSSGGADGSSRLFCAALIFRNRDGRQLNLRECLRIRLTGSLGGGFNPSVRALG